MSILTTLIDWVSWLIQRTAINSNFSTLNSEKAEISWQVFTGAISATNLSGTNTGDNATNTTSNAYALTTPDFYKYQIVRTVSSGNLTVALKNYEGNDPTPSKPVKIQIGGVIRTITSATSYTRASGVNWMNCWSAELATKEIDFFTYLYWSWSIVKIAFWRIVWTIAWDFSSNALNEKFMEAGYELTATDPVANIGRFNAILSGGAWYTWSIPATSVVENSKIYTTKYKDYFANPSGFTTSSQIAYYMINSNQISIIFDLSGTSNSTSMTFKLPFTPTIIGPDFSLWLTYDNWTAKTVNWRCTCSGNTVTCYSDAGSWAWTNSWAKIVRGQFNFTIQ